MTKQHKDIVHGIDISIKNVTYQGGNGCGVSWLGKRKQISNQLITKSSDTFFQKKTLTISKICAFKIAF